nr:hypothetical protein [Halorubrum aethiopicum]
MTALTTIAAALGQAGVLGDPIGQLLVALVVAAIVIVVGKFVLKLAWRLITIGILVVAVFYGLSVAGLV